MARKSKKNGKTSAAGPSLWRRLGKWTATLVVWGLIATLFAAGWFYTDLPDVEDSLAPSRRPTVWVLDAGGKEIAAVGDLYGIPVRLSDLPPALPQAVLATEDRRYYDHFGIDPIGLARAMFANLRAGRIVQGGSTITQQVAKNLFLSSERTYKRKIQEVMLALWLEHRFSKDQILELYLNRVYLGAGTYGVDAAARKYFNKPASALNVWESAMLAGLLKAPSRYNPHSDDERAEKRTRVVLANMVAAGYLTDEQARKARGASTKSTTSRPGRTAPYFVDWILDQVQDYTGARDRDLIVQTTLDRDAQLTAERTLAGVIAKAGKQRKIGNGAVLLLTPDGAVKAMVGGSNYAATQFNRATQAQRQPGSAFKPFVYLAGLKAGLSPDDVIEDAPIKIGNWEPSNFNGEFTGPTTVSDGLARSVNTVAVRVAMKAGISRVADTARTLGIDPGEKPDASIALGTVETTLLELVSAYAPFANGGNGVIPFGIVEIRDGGGEILYRRTGSGPGQAVQPYLVGPMNNMLHKAITEGTGKAANFGRDAAGKTGTSQNYRDAWFVGYTADFIAGVWLGNDDGAPMNHVTGGSYPARIWRDVMAAAHGGLPARDLPRPSDDRGFFSRLFETIEDAKQEAQKAIDDVEPKSAAPGTSSSGYFNRN
ncbi:MAG: PBP1A family penicillin-binding protein [Rhodospirillales bacterium]|nr:PBP1A family penicillin-binding protein [Rhodospirillales bacterium]MBO6788455.1 PBP1A family penicillin-binding protein [Rhodospirillales bacterium]